LEHATDHFIPVPAQRRRAVAYPVDLVSQGIAPGTEHGVAQEGRFPK
jgi:hypothetical protein